MKKKVVSALLCATMVATMFAGCGSKESDNNASTPDLKKMPSNLSIFFIIDLLLAIRFYQ